MGSHREPYCRRPPALAALAVWVFAAVAVFACPALAQIGPLADSSMHIGLDSEVPPGAVDWDVGQSFPSELATATTFSLLPQTEPLCADLPGDDATWCEPAPRCDWVWGLNLLARGYYLNDQRLQWSGTETTFGAEGVVAPVVVHRWDGWQTAVEGEFYLNQPLDRNRLLDTRERRSYAANFDVEPFEISMLSIVIGRGDLAVQIGKVATPFGRTCFPLFTNARLDAPFIRTESILWRETGVVLRYHPGWLAADVAITNGSEDRDTNSSKALVARLGAEQPRWAAGVSVKTQDGIGSERQKQYNNHAGVDFMLRTGRWVLSGEAIYDEYGFRMPQRSPWDITWPRSIYYRDQFYRQGVPVTGIGYYVSLGYQQTRWQTWLDYGEFYPQELGIPQHDVPKRRGIVKCAVELTSHLTLYGVTMIENGDYAAQDDRPRRGIVVLGGLQWSL